MMYEEITCCSRYTPKVSEMVEYVLRIMKSSDGGDTEPFVLWSLDLTSLILTNPTLTLKEGQRVSGPFDG